MTNARKRTMRCSRQTTCNLCLTDCERAEITAKKSRIRTDLLAACNGLIEDKDLVEQDEGITACQCTTKMPEDAIEPLPCIYCVAKAAIAKAEDKP